MGSRILLGLLLADAERHVSSWLPNGRKQGHEWCAGDLAGAPGDSLKVNLASVQVVGPDGKVMKTDLKGQGELNPSRRVVVEGKVAPESTKDSLVINATGVFVEPKG